MKTKELGALNDTVNRNREFILMDVPLMWDDNCREFLRSVKTALCLDAWINESSENQLMEIFGITPGELRRKLEIADWLIYCLIEVALLLKKRNFLPLLRKLRIKLNYGVKEELLKLVSLREIGRVRSRRLFESGIKDIRDLRKTSSERLVNILGPKIALKVRVQLLGDKR